MRLEHLIRRARIVVIAGTLVATSVSAFGQSGQSRLTEIAKAAAQGLALQPGETLRTISIDEAVKLGLEQNLGIQIQRYDPQIQDTAVSQARSFWSPQISATLSKQSQSQAVTNSLAGGANSITNGNLFTGASLSQTLPWGASYTANWNNQRITTNNLFTTFSPQIASNVNFQFSQPLLRNFSIDAIRNQVALTKKGRELSDIQLDSVIVQTTRAVRNAYWDLSASINNLKAQQESLALSQQSLSDNRKRVEIGTLAPIDIVQAQAEVASNEERVIVAEALIKRAQDNLRALILDPSAADFFATTFEPSDAAPFQEQAIDIDGAVRNALDKRADLRSAKNSVERSDIDIRYLRNQILPDINAQAAYITRGVGGVQLSSLSPDDVLAGNFDRRVLANRGFGSVLGDVFQNAYPDWTVGVQIAYPLGSSTAHANLARARLEYQQSQTQLKNVQMQISTQVREAGRNVQTNQKRVQSARASRELQEKKLEAEEKKQAAGMSTSFFVFQAQRDLAQARTLEIQAIADYNKSMVDFEAIQLAPLSGANAFITVAGQASIQTGGGGNGNGNGNGNGRQQ
jgi:outer membrane protein TolC